MPAHAPLHHLNIGEIIISSEPAVISTVLGSCISVCLYHPQLRIGGMIHYAHPRVLEGEGDFRYGTMAIQTLVEELEKLSNAPIKQFKAKVVGGASDVDGEKFTLNVGEQNVAIAEDMLKKFGIAIVGRDTGGKRGRKVLFHTHTGELQVAWLGSGAGKDLQKRKVLIVDDSKVIRDLISHVLNESEDFEIIGLAANTSEAEKILAKQMPDVITLDIHMPGLTGVEWLARLLPRNPIPVVMISSLRFEEGNEVFRALELGAVDYIQKPSLNELPAVGPLIRDKVKAASFAKVQMEKEPAKVAAISDAQIDLNKILVIGASTGGTEAIKTVVTALPASIPPTLIVQHIPPVFSKAFAERLQSLCPFEVKEAQNGDELRESRVLIAPGGKQMKIVRTPTGYCVRITDDLPVNRHKPSVDFLFHSVAELIGSETVGVILTGMGADGAKGLLEIRKSGAKTIAQDEKTSVVFGMPKAAIELGAVERVVPLGRIAHEIVNALSIRKAAS